MRLVFGSTDLSKPMHIFSKFGLVSQISVGRMKTLQTASLHIFAL